MYVNYAVVFVVQDYPDYYEVIRRPIDMQKVLQRMTALQYQTVDDMVADFVLMFDNACKYNEPESLIYKVCFSDYIYSVFFFLDHNSIL